MKLLKYGAAAAAVLLGTAASAQAAVILAPVSVKIDIGGQAGTPWKAENMINQSGLDKKYVAGVTDFDAYLASNPIHNTGPSSEWADRGGGATTARFTVDFGTEVTIGSLAMWDEDQSSLGRFFLSTPEAGTFASFMNVDGPRASAYGAQVFGFRPITTRYLTFDLTGCGEAGYNHAGCSLREIAFEAATLSAVPEPATWAMMITGFAGVGAAIRRQRRQSVFA